MRALVTGGSGFVGANLVRRLLHDGHEVHLLGRVTSDWRLKDVRSDVELHETDLLDPDGVGRAVAAARPDRAFHLAAYGAYSWQQDARRMVDVNVTATTVVLAACLDAGVGAFVHAGTSSEYGFKDHAPAEDEPLEPASAYAVTKAAASLWCAHLARDVAQPVVVLRLYSLYGPWEDPGRFVPALVAAGVVGRLPPLADPRTARDFVYVDDAVEAFVLAADAQTGAVYNVGSGVQTPLESAVEQARSAFDVSEVPEWGSFPDRTWDTDVWRSDPARIDAELGWRATTSFSEGLRRTADWLADAPAPVRARYGLG